MIWCKGLNSPSRSHQREAISSNFLISLGSTFCVAVSGVEAKSIEAILYRLCYASVKSGHYSALSKSHQLRCQI
ncbi:Uncharacterised protein [Vibrio cholerae]|nr:Uncharacterised protein [Vibrio cholerae]